MVDIKKETIEAIVEKYQRPLLRYTLQIIGDIESARDIVQECFLRLWKADYAKIEVSLAPWLFTVCRNLAFDFRRKGKRLEPLFNVEYLPNNDEGADSVEQNELLGKISAAMSKLSEKQREVVRLKFQNDLSYKEISEITGHSVSNVGFLIHEGVKALRSEMEKNLGIFAGGK